jgi:hypothetical protein
MKRKMSLIFAALSSIFLISIPAAAIASTSISYDFDTAGDLTSGFNSYVNSGTISQSLTGGISNSGAIYTPSSANAVFASKASYSLGPVGSSYTFTSFLKSVGNSGYSGMGFTALTPSSANASGNPYRPTDALGISVHGGGFVFHNGATDFSGQWNSNNAGGITNVQLASISDLLNSGSSDQWYKIILTITRDSSSTFDMHVEVWPSSSTGVLLHQQASAIFELNNQTNTALTSAPALYSYINFSGYRVTHFDNYQVSLSGGSSVIQAGAPVVLTTDAVAQSNVVTFDGSVTATGGAAVTERGFVYSTSPSPTISDNKVPIGSGVGSFSGITSTLPNGTYYFRAYATNSTGTSYGVEEQLTLASVIATPTPSPSSSSVPSSAPASSAQTVLAQTGVNIWQATWLLLSSVLMINIGVLLLRKTSQLSN